MLKDKPTTEMSKIKFHIGDTVEVLHSVSEQNHQVFWVGMITDSHFDNSLHCFEYFVEFSRSEGGWYTAPDLKEVS